MDHKPENPDVRQECIPVGCVLTAAVTATRGQYLGDVYLVGGVSLLGDVGLLGGVSVPLRSVKILLPKPLGLHLTLQTSQFMSR